MSKLLLLKRNGALIHYTFQLSLVLTYLPITYQAFRQNCGLRRKHWPVLFSAKLLNETARPSPVQTLV